MNQPTPAELEAIRQLDFSSTMLSALAFVSSPQDRAALLASAHERVQQVAQIIANAMREASHV